jgi:hypothetical protein
LNSESEGDASGSSLEAEEGAAPFSEPVTNLFIACLNNLAACHTLRGDSIKVNATLLFTFIFSHCKVSQH